MQRQGQMGPDGEPVASTRRQPPRPAARAAAPTANRAKPAEFLSDVRSELRRVAWPNRAEVINYSTVVLITLAVLMLLIFLLDTAFAKAVLFLFKK